MVTLFLEGGWIPMSVLTAELVCLLLAAWKVPAWVREIGLLALVTGIFFPVLSLYNGFAIIQQAGGISPTLFLGAVRLAFIPAIYGMLIYALSLVIRMVRKPGC